MSKPSVLFVIGFDPNSIGGAFISTISIAKGLQDLGHNVGILMAQMNVPIEEFLNSKIEMHYYPYPRGIGAFFSRPFAINRAIKERNYTHVITVDTYSALQSIIPVLVNRKSILQIIPGGTADIPPINIPGIIVFSEELYTKLIDQFDFPSSNIIISCGQVKFDNYTLVTNPDRKNELGFERCYKKVLTISRLSGSKIIAIKALLDQVEIASTIFPIQCFIIGDGPDRPILEEYSRNIMKNSLGKLDIRFLGAFRVEKDHLQQADLIVGQGRTVIEGIASRIPSAVCGSNGYCGLLRAENFRELVSSNLTGRGLHHYSSLVEDLEQLDEYMKNEMNNVYMLSFERYDVLGGVLKIADLLDSQEFYLERKFNVLMASIKICSQAFQVWIRGKFKR